MTKTIPLEYDSIYHIYNRGINGTDLFQNNENYKHFLELYSIYIQSIADTYAWCLMKNHFHLLVHIKPDNEIGFLNPKNKSVLDKHDKWRTQYPKTTDEKQLMQHWKKPIPHLQFSHLFDTYAKTYNNHYHRTGGLFEEPFERIKVNDERYFKNLVVYIHQNPVKHGFTDTAIDYAWSSYSSLISIKPTQLHRETVMGWFNGKGEFVEYHKNWNKEDEIVDYIIEK